MATLLTQFLAVNDFRSGSKRHPDARNLGTAGRSMTRQILLGRSIFSGGRTDAAKVPLSSAVRRDRFGNRFRAVSGVAREYDGSAGNSRRVYAGYKGSRGRCRWMPPPDEGTAPDRRDRNEMPEVRHRDADRRRGWPKIVQSLPSRSMRPYEDRPCVTGTCIHTAKGRSHDAPGCSQPRKGRNSLTDG
jgi:hypothetical protein